MRRRKQTLEQQVAEWALAVAKLRAELELAHETCLNGIHPEETCRVGSHDNVPPEDFCEACKAGRAAWARAKALRPRVYGMKRRLVDRGLELAGEIAIEGGGAGGNDAG